MASDTHQIPIRFPADMWPRVQKSAERYDMSINELTLELYRKAFQHADRKAAAAKDNTP